MKKTFTFLAAMAVLSVSGNAYAEKYSYGSYGKCDFLPEKKAPQWIGAGYKRSGYYMGVGTAGRRETVDEQMEASKHSALTAISSTISVTIKSTLRDTLIETSRGGASEMEQEIEMETDTSVEQTLRDTRYEDMWLDRKNCQLWTLAVVTEESVEAMKKEIEEKLQRKFTSKNLMLFSFNDNEISGRVYGNMEKLFRDMNVKVITDSPEYLECAKGDYSPVCRKMPETIFGGFGIKYENQKTSDDGSHKANFYSFRGALYFKERRITSFGVTCRGVGRTDQDASIIESNAAASCVRKIRKKLKADMQKYE